MYVVKHMYDAIVNGQYEREEKPVAVFDDEAEAYEYADKYFDLKAYGFTPDGRRCLIFGDLDVEEFEEEEDFVNCFGVSSVSIPCSGGRPDFEEFEEKRTEFLRGLSKTRRFPRLTYTSIEDKSEFDGNGYLYTECSADEGNDTIYRRGGFVNRIGYVVFDRDPVEDAKALGSSLDIEDEFCMGDLEPLYEEIIWAHSYQAAAGPMMAWEAGALADKAYKTYQMEWMLSHGYGLADLKEALMENIKLLLEDADAPADAESCIELFENAVSSFLDSDGFGRGGCFACRNEFIDLEFHDRKYMERLFGLSDSCYDKDYELARWERALEVFDSDRLFAVNIKWDTDEGDDVEALPGEIEIPDPKDEGWDLEKISDYITDKTGFCHKGFSVEWREKE